MVLLLLCDPMILCMRLAIFTYILQFGAHVTILKNFVESG